MKILFASDMHGSVYDMYRLIERIEAETPDEAIFLGDFCGFTPVSLMREAFEKIPVPMTYITGNCDSDHTLSAMGVNPCGLSLKKIVDGKRVFATHGHIFNRINHPTDIDLFFYGHLHTPFITEENGVTFVNVGSAAKPRDGGKTYATFGNNCVRIKDLEFGDIIEEKRL